MMNDQANNTGESLTQQPFYDEGRISDPNIASDLAYVEGYSGRESALKLEGALKNGFTNEEEKYNSEVMEMLKKEFPNALQEIVDEETGEIVYVAGISIFESNRTKFRRTEKSFAVRYERLPLAREKVGYDNIGQYLLEARDFAFHGLAFSKRGVIDLRDLKDSKSVFNIINTNQNYSFDKLSQGVQKKIFIGLDFLERFGKELDTRDINTLDDIRKQIQSVKESMDLHPHEIRQREGTLFK